MNILHIDSSVLGDNSASRQLSATIVARLRAEHPAATVSYRDLAAQSLPHYTPILADDHPCVARNAEILDEFLAADTVVIGAPMYNFTVPTQLKAWFDRILIARKTFQYTDHGVEGLAGGKRVIVASSRGGIYSSGPAQAVDFQEPWLRHVLGMMGISDIEVIRAEGLNLGAEQRVSAMQHALGQIEAELQIAA